MKIKLYILASFTLFILYPLNAQTFEVSGINYNIISADEVEVTSKSGCYVGDLTIPDVINYLGNTYNVTEIGFEAFKNCDITSIALPNSISTIRQYAFRDCRELRSLVIPNSVTEIESAAFLYCTKLVSVDLPNQITILDRFIFANCNALTEIDIPEMVQTIDGYAFTNCNSLETVTIPSTVATIGVRAFDDCISLSTFNVSVVSPIAINSEVFNNVNLSDVNLYVPPGSETEYSTASVWQDFGSINAILSTPNYEKTKELLIYPNPTLDFISISGLKTIENYDIYNLNGEKIASGSLSSENFIDLQNLSAGIYIIKVGDSFIEKLIKK